MGRQARPAEAALPSRRRAPAYVAGAQAPSQQTRRTCNAQTRRRTLSRARHSTSRSTAGRTPRRRLRIGDAGSRSVRVARCASHHRPSGRRFQRPTRRRSLLRCAALRSRARTLSAVTRTRYIERNGLETDLLRRLSCSRPSAEASSTQLSSSLGPTSPVCTRTLQKVSRLHTYSCAVYRGPP